MSILYSLPHRYLLTITVLPLLTFNEEIPHVAVQGLSDAQDVFGQRAVRHAIIKFVLFACHAYLLELSQSCRIKRVASAECSRPGPDGLRTKYRKAEYRIAKYRTQNIEVAEYQVAKYRMRKISKLLNIVSHNIEWQNIDNAKYRRTKYRLQNIEW